LKTRPCKFFGLHGLFIFAACTFSVITQMGFYKKFYSIFNKKANHLTEYWDSKEQFTCEKQFGDELFNLQDHKNCQEILLKISLK
jgi:hypothetical protein